MALLIDQNSMPSSKAELDVFSVPSTQVAVKSGFWHEVPPQNTLTDAGPYTFHIPSDPHFLDLSKNYILLQLEITKGAARTPLAWDGVQVALADKVGPIQMIGKTFFKQVKLYLGSKLAYDSGDTYAYRAFLETELNYNEGYKNCFLSSAGYKSDAPHEHVDDDQNTGWAARCEWFRTEDLVNPASRVVEFMAPLHADLFHQEKYLINRVDVRLELYRNSDAFCLMNFGVQPNRLNIRVVDMKWIIRKVDPVESVSLALESALLRTTVKYPIRRVLIKTLQLEQGRRDTPSTTLFNGQIPRRMVVCLVSNQAYHGEYERSPFNLQHFHTTSIQIIAGGVSYPPNPLEMDFDRGHIARPFIQMYEALGLAGLRRNNWLDPEDFQNGSCMFVFDLSPDSSDDAHWELLKEGATTIRMTFSAAIPAGGVKLIALAEFDNLITIDRFRNVYFDYTA
jgi:hypothetical protein